MHLLIIVTLVVLVFVFIFYRQRKPPEILTVSSRFEREITDQQFDELVLSTSYRVPVVVDFYANWCTPCRSLTPLLAELAVEYEGAFVLVKINHDACSVIKKRFKINSLPTVLLFSNGMLVERLSGGHLAHTIRYSLALHGIKRTKNCLQAQK